MSATTTPPSNPPEGPHEDEPPEPELIVRAAQRLVRILADPARTRGDRIRAVDALGRAVLRLKKSL